MAHVLTSPRFSAPFGTLGLVRIQAGLAAWRQRRALVRLDDNARRDLGLTEADVARETSRPVWDVPQRWLM